MLQTRELKLCQSCIERGYNPPNPASREWQEGIYYCDDCFNALLNNLTNIAPAEVTQHLPSVPSGPILPQIYELMGIPVELQFDSVDRLAMNRDKLFNFHSPAIVNRTIENIKEEIEQLSMVIFHCNYKKEPLEMELARLKDVRRKEKNLTSYNDSKEEYSKAPKKGSTVKQSQEEKMAKTLGLSLDAYRALVGSAKDDEKKAKERKFNILAGNCPDCGNSWPCNDHPNASFL